MSKALVDQSIRHSLRFAKRLYQSLPLSYRTRALHRRTLSRLFPKVLFLSGNQPSSIPALSIPTNLQLATRPDAGNPQPNGFSIDLSTSSSPVVSIIIPMFGKIEYTLQCLASIEANPPKSAFEVIVIDDGSPDGTGALNRVNGIRVLRNQNNLGFIRSCNLGARAAAGEYLHFLNNDTCVTPDWLDELLRTFREFPGTGLVGSRLLYPDGRLQEAGGIIWRDGTAWNFGRFQDPKLPEYNYAREVDYCSGASILVPRALFTELGEFDEHYLPAYCEDSDLALKIRAKGHRVIYQALSTVIHFEGTTSGTDTSRGIKSHQIGNSVKLFQRWQERLRSHQAPGTDVNRAKDRMATRRVLVLDHCTPRPNQDAGSVTVANILLLLRDMGFQVTFIPEADFLFLPGYTADLQRVGIEVLYAPYVLSVKHHLKQNGERYDLVLLFRPTVADRNIKAIRTYCPNAKTLFHTVDLHFLRIQRESELMNDRSTLKFAAEMKQVEFDMIRRADASIVHSTVELDLLRQELPHKRIHVFPLIMDVHGTEIGFASRRDLVFIGGYQHPPNVDAAKFLVEQIMPLLRSRLPGIRLHLVGSNARPTIGHLASEDVIVTGFVEDLNALLDQMRISVAPLRYGAGIKGKIGSAMVVGLPVVATRLAAEGMSLIDGENVLLADGAEEFAATVARLYTDEALWKKLSMASIAHADDSWGAEAAWRTLADILIGIGLNIERGAHPLRLCSSSIPPEEPFIPSQREKSLRPSFTASNRQEYEHGVQLPVLARIRRIERFLVDSAGTDTFTVSGFCEPCKRTVPFLVDGLVGGYHVEGRLVPNWRERLVCSHCQMNNRQRLIATLINDLVARERRRKIYLMEQVTPIYHWARASFPQHDIVGSEYMGDGYRSGELVDGIRHEDSMNLSFDDGSLDLLISNDVFEHVPDPHRAFAECARVLRPNGVMFATIPFHSDRDRSVARAEIGDTGLRYLLPQMFHGNPISDDGSLVCTDFGWDVLDAIQAAGFSTAAMEAYTCAERGHLGGAMLVIRATR